MIENKFVVLEVKDKSIEIKALDEGIVEKWSEISKREGVDVSKDIIYGDRLYEEVL